MPVSHSVTHSWGDDPKAKWVAIQGVRERFRKEHRREPILWFDKYCIDQTNIDEAIRRLPFFVVASSKFLVLLGPSYVVSSGAAAERLQSARPPP